MKIVVAGASGLVGSAVVAHLRGLGHEVVCLGRRAGPDTAVWDPAAAPLDPAVVDAATAVINLAGAGIADGRWTAARREEIRESRVQATRRLVEAMVAAPARPEVLVNASGLGYYGDGGDRELDEQAPPGEGFLAGVCRVWETEAERARAVGVRVVAMRLGLVLAADGGALAKMLPAFRAGLGGPAGDGRQWVSWVTVDDVAMAVAFLLEQRAITGAVNVVAPGPVRQAEFAAALGRVLGRPSVMRAPKTMLRLMFGAMAEETVLASQRGVPAVLVRAGFQFHHAGIEAALRHVLGR